MNNMKLPRITASATSAYDSTDRHASHPQVPRHDNARQGTNPTLPSKPYIAEHHTKPSKPSKPSNTSKPSKPYIAEHHTRNNDGGPTLTHSAQENSTTIEKLTVLQQCCTPQTAAAAVQVISVTAVAGTRCRRRRIASCGYAAPQP